MPESTQLRTTPAEVMSSGSGNFDRLYDRPFLAALTGRSEASLIRDQRNGVGCPHVKVGHLVRYRASDIQAYLAGLLPESK